MPYHERHGWPQILLGGLEAEAFLTNIADEAARAMNDRSPTNAVQFVSAPAGPGEHGLPESAVGTDSPLWWIIERGQAYAGVYSPAYAPIRNGFDDVGLPFEFEGGPA